MRTAFLEQSAVLAMTSSFGLISVQTPGNLCVSFGGTLDLAYDDERFREDVPLVIFSGFAYWVCLQQAPPSHAS